MLRLLPVLAVLWLLLTGAASGKSVHTAEPPLGDFLVKLPEVSESLPCRSPEGSRVLIGYIYDGPSEGAYCHNDPVNKVDVLGLREKTIVSPDPLNRFRRGANGEWEVRLVDIETGFWGNRSDFVRDKWVSTSSQSFRLSGYRSFNEQGGVLTSGSEFIQATAAATGWDENAQRDLTLIAGGSMTTMLAAPYVIATSPAWGTAGYVQASNLTAAGMTKIGAGATLLQQGYQRVGPLLTRASYSPTLHSIASDGAHSYAIRPGSMGAWWQSVRFQRGSVINPFYRAKTSVAESAPGLNWVTELPKGGRPHPAAYLSVGERTAVESLFDQGAVRFTSLKSIEKYGTAGSADAFVFPRSLFDEVIAEAGGNLRLIEQRLGLDAGYLGDADTVAAFIGRSDFSRLRVPAGNEAGANSHWISGGVTSGGVPEMILDLSSSPFTIVPFR